MSNTKDNDKYLLNEQFMNELLRLCFRRKDVIDVCVVNLKFHYIKSEPYKEIWQSLKNHYVNNNEIPSFGTIAQTLQSSLGKKASVTLSVLSDIKTSDLANQSDVLNKLEVFIRDSMSVEFYNEFAEKYKEGDRDGARALLVKKADEISSFSIIKGTSLVDKVFDGFDNRNDMRSFDHNNHTRSYQKVPFSIDELDLMSNGGADPTDTFCAIMRSGAGKTKFLRHVGVGAVRRGINVLHLQAEGSKKSCLNGYDATWTACLMSDIKKGSIPDDKFNSLNKIVSSMRSKGSDIYVHAFEQFGLASIADARAIVQQLLKQVDHIGLILCDYLELFDPADGIRYTPHDERFRRLSIANKFKNMAVEFECVGGTATQANDIPAKLLEDPEFVMTRSNVSECKGLVNPFSFYFSGNQTRDEYQDGKMRLYIDKLRDYKSDKVITIYQNYKYDRFYDKRKTLQALSTIDPE